MKYPVPDEWAPDARKSLAVLREENEGCKHCRLSERREQVGGFMVHGAGNQNAKIMIIGDAPSQEDEATGEPFSGADGQNVLWPAIEELEMADMVYVTNLVLCRSCTNILDADGEIMQQYNRETGEHEPKVQDQPPTYPEQAACSPRLYEEIYIVDPLLIVAMGRATAEFLAGSPVAVHTDNELRPIQIPGASRSALLTEKRRVWGRRSKNGNTAYPTKRSEVRYMMLPCVHPSYLARNLQQIGKNPYAGFVAILQMARDIVLKYTAEMERR